MQDREFSSCYSEVEGLIKLCYFPATPKFPTMAFLFTYLNLLFWNASINPRLCICHEFILRDIIVMRYMHTITHADKNRLDSQNDISYYY